ncbi:kinase-like domain-containing protein [Pholiota molesta]|nr:kinase-like domain-containing protein [Pholiota molesta]
MSEQLQSNSEDYSDSEESGSELSEDQPPPTFPAVIANWFLNENLGSGYSGSIFKATHIHTRQVVALKIQYVHHENPTNKFERHLYPLLQGGVGMPKLYASGIQGAWDFLAIDLLGSSLDSLHRKSGKDTMDLRSVVQLLSKSRLQFMHHRGVLHRDIQLGNCVIGLPPNEKLVYMIDFGFSKRYIDPYTGRHIPDSKLKRDFIGNYWFSSVNVHCRGKVPSRRDDLEAAALMFIHLLTPRGLSWTRNGVPKTDEAHNRLKAEKRKATPESLCRGLPIEFEEFLAYTRRLAFKENPDYGQWIRKFRDLAVDEGFDNIDQFIWPPPIPAAPLIKTVNTPLRARTPAVPRDEMADILNDLTKLNLAAKPILGDRTNVQQAVLKAQADAKLDSSEQAAAEGSGVGSKRAIVISSGSERSGAFDAPDNATLSQLVKEFKDVLQINSSRTLTREAFYFLDVLYKQLDDPSVFIKPARCDFETALLPSNAPEKEPPHTDVHYSQSNKALAAMVSDFAKVTNKSTGRTVTKDGFAFLDGLADRLKALK